MAERLRDSQRNIGDLTAAVLRHDPRRQLSAARESLAACQSRLGHALERTLAIARSRAESTEARLYRGRAQVSVAARRAAYFRAAWRAGRAFAARRLLNQAVLAPSYRTSKAKSFAP